MGKLTVEKTVILEASSAKECVERMHCLLLRNTLSTRTINIWGAFRRQGSRISQLYISVICKKILIIHTTISGTKVYHKLKIEKIYISWHFIHNQWKCNTFSYFSYTLLPHTINNNQLLEYVRWLGAGLKDSCKLITLRSNTRTNKKSLLFFEFICRTLVREKSWHRLEYGKAREVSWSWITWTFPIILLETVNIMIHTMWIHKSQYM